MTWFADIQGLLDGDIAANLATSIGNLQADFAQHLEQSMPHKTADGTHLWNLKINIDGSLTFVFEEV